MKMISFKEFLRLIVFLLGVYEFLSIAIILLKNDVRDSQSDFLLLDSELVVSKTPVLYLLFIFVFFLGLNRVTWAVTAHLYPAQNNFLLWLNVVLLHSAELILFWSLALMPHFNTNNYGLVELYQNVLTLNVGNGHSRDVLVVVPLLLLIILAHGPKS